MNKRARLRAELAALDIDLTAGAEVIDSALELLREPGQLYAALPETGQRQFLQAFFEKLCVADEGVTGDELRPPFEESVTVYRRQAWPPDTSTPCRCLQRSRVATNRSTKHPRLTCSPLRSSAMV